MSRPNRAARRRSPRSPIGAPPSGRVARRYVMRAEDEHVIELLEALSHGPLLVAEWTEAVGMRFRPWNEAFPRGLVAALAEGLINVRKGVLHITRKGRAARRAEHEFNRQLARRAA